MVVRPFFRFVPAGGCAATPAENSRQEGAERLKSHSPAEIVARSLAAPKPQRVTGHRQL